MVTCHLKSLSIDIIEYDVDEFLEFTFVLILFPNNKVFS